MASAERKPITGVCGRSPQRSPGAEPLVRGQLKCFHLQEGFAPEAGSILPLQKCKWGANLSVFIGSNSLYCKYSMGQKMVFTHSAITPPKMNRFG